MALARAGGRARRLVARAAPFLGESRPRGGRGRLRAGGCPSEKETRRGVVGAASLEAAPVSGVKTRRARCCRSAAAAAAQFAELSRRHMRWDGPIRRGPGGRRHASCREEASAGLLWRISGPGRVQASLLVPYCTLASCGGGAHYWARRDARVTRRASLLPRARLHRCRGAAALATKPLRRPGALEIRRRRTRTRSDTSSAKQPWAAATASAAARAAGLVLETAGRAASRPRQHQHRSASTTLN